MPYRFDIMKEELSHFKWQAWLKHIHLECKECGWIHTVQNSGEVSELLISVHKHWIDCPRQNAS
jgi:hypothetical protein